MSQLQNMFFMRKEVAALLDDPFPNMIEGYKRHEVLMERSTNKSFTLKPRTNVNVVWKEVQARCHGIFNEENNETEMQSRIKTRGKVFLPCPKRW